MTFVALPLRNDALVFDFFTQLSLTNYYFRFYFNQNDASWYFDLADDTQLPIASGIKVVLGALLLGRVGDARKPPGGMVAVALFAPEHEEAGPADLNNRVKVLYDDDTI